MTEQDAPVTLEDVTATPDAPTPDGGHTPPARRFLATVGVVALAASAVVGGNLFGLRDRLMGSESPTPRVPAASREAAASTPTTASPTLLRSWPWWQDVATLEGDGAGPVTFTIGDDAIQWRLRGTCQTGRLVVAEPSGTKPLLTATCTGAPSEYAITSRVGTKRLQVSAEGPWQLEVDQQVDVPLVEPPLPGMSAPGTEVVATGELYRMDQTGEGTITVYRLADGTHALRLEDFFVTANVDLEIRFHPLEAPRTTEDYLSAPAPLAAPLDITTGSLNFILPRDLDPTRYKSIVIWCPLINSAYAGATLRPAG